MADTEENEQTNILVEIISCWKLLKGDFRSSDPYVKVKMGGKDIHKTKHMTKTLDPVFTVKHDALFCLEVSRLALEKNNGLTFKVKDHDPMGGSDELGSVNVPADVILKADDTRVEYELTPPAGQSKKKAGFIALKFRPATDTDAQFLQHVKEGDESKSAGGLFGKASAMSGFGYGTATGLFTQNKVKDRDTGVTSYRVRPGPDPDNVKETEWMSKNQIETESLKPSKKWLDVGSGDLGKIYLEILGCDGLENKDSGLQKSNKTDSFCALVYEDCMAKTDCVDDCLSPRLLPWTKRAFILRMQHPSSMLNIGVFDSDTGPLAKHQTIGKVSITLANFKPRTEYLLDYNLYESAKIAEREPKGILKIRMRIEYNSQRKAILSALGSIPKITVNVDNKSDYRIVRKTIQGRTDTRNYDIDILKSYIHELTLYQQAAYYIQDALKTVLFWHGTYPLTIPLVKKTLYLPVHSAVAFAMGIFLAEKPRLFPSFFFFGVAWLMCAVMWHNHFHPDPWVRCKSFGGFFMAMLLGFQLPENIEAHENEEQAIAAKEEWEKRVQEGEEKAAKKAEKAAEEQKEYEKMMEEIGENPSTEDEETDKSGFPKINLLKPILFPIQKNLALVCYHVRFARNVITWNESYFSFWLTFISLLLGVIFVFIPWVFIARWIFRILVWTFLGPWMYFVDKCYLQRKKPPTEEQLEKKEEEEEKEISERLEAKSDELRRQREEALKAKDMKAALYGKYETAVPVLQNDRYVDYPLHTSSATPYHYDDDDIKGVERVGGQELPGESTPLLPKQD